MERFERDGWLIEYDADRTRQAYWLTDRGAHECTCAYCRNYIAIRDSQYPVAFRALLALFGIDIHKEVEVWQVPAARAGMHFYAGWYHFIGTIVNDPGTRMTINGELRTADWHVSFQSRSDLAIEPLKGLSLVQLDFDTEMPWGLNEPPSV